MQFDENSIVPSLICVAPVASEMHRTKYGSGGVSGLVLGVKSSDADADADELAACVTSVGGGVARGLVTIALCPALWWSGTDRPGCWCTQ